MHPFEILDTAQRASLAVVDQVSAEHRSRPTPCDGWDVAKLLDKIVTSPRIFAALCRGEKPAEQYNLLFPTEAAGDDPAASYRAAIEDCTAAFTASELEGEMMGPLGVAVPRQAGLMVRSLDCTINTWDLATSIGVEHGVPTELVDALTPFAEGFLPKVRAKEDHPRFGAPVETASAGMAHLVALSGRDPGWS